MAPGYHDSACQPRCQPGRICSLPPSRHRPRPHTRFFLRVQSDGQVISDSHSFRKNETAARQIERELKLNTPTPTKPADQIGDREPTQNAAKRAERRGTADPSIDVAAVRLALSDARDRDHLKQLLEAEGIEAEFDRRGQDQNIYGWRLRRRGAAEWLKASTVARDLSWPKIAHRFAESNSAKQTSTDQPTTPASTYPSSPAQPQRQVLDRPPQQLQPVPQAVYAANQMQTPGPVAKRLGEVSERLDEMMPAVSTSTFLNATWALAKVAVMCATAAANIAAALWRFIQRLLSLFGLKTNQPLQYQEQPVTPQLTYEPVHHGRVLESSELTELDKNAASAVDHVLECVQSNRPDELPEDVPERAELIEAMTSQAKTGVPAAAQAAPLDALFNDHQAPPLPKSEPKIEPIDTFVLLNTALAEFVDASIARTESLERDTLQVVAARKNLAAANQQLQSAKLTYQAERNKKGIFKSFVPAEAVVVENEQIAFNQAQKGLAAAETQHPSTTPPALQERHADALAKLKTAAAQHHAKMLRDVDQHANAKVKKIALYQAQSFKAHLDIFERAPIAGHLFSAVQVAESAPKSIATALTIAVQEEEMAAGRNVYVPGQARNDDDTDGQR